MMFGKFKRTKRSERKKGRVSGVKEKYKEPGGELYLSLNGTNEIRLTCVERSTVSVYAFTDSGRFTHWV